MDGIFLIDKPLGITSHDVVAFIKKKYKQSKVGHAGTLDPLATGLLLVMVGNATKLSEYFMQGVKKYYAKIQFGFSTDTWDVHGKVINRDNKVILREEINNKINVLIGSNIFPVPIYSAKKINGHKLYQYARQKKEAPSINVEMTVYSVEIINYSYPYLDILIVCSHGTYIRSLAMELGRIFQCNATLHTLRRIESGGFCVSNATTLIELQDKHLIKIEKLLDNCLIINKDSEKKVANGNFLMLKDIIDIRNMNENNTLYNVYNDDGVYLGIYKKELLGFKYILKVKNL